MYKKISAAFLATTLFAAGCSDSDNESSPIPTPTPTYKDNITLIEPSGLSWKEAELDKTAIILADGDDSRPTIIQYGLQNETNNTYFDISFSVDPADDSKYTVTDDMAGKSMSYGDIISRAVTINITPHALGAIRFNLMMNSGGQQSVSWPVNVAAMYLLQPAYKDASGKMAPVTDTTDITEKSSAKFYVFNSYSMSVPIKGLNFEKGTEGFTINSSEPEDEEGYPNCAGDSFAVVNSKKACFLLIEFNNPAVGTYTDTLNIIQTSAHYKNSSIPLSAVVK